MPQSLRLWRAPALVVIALALTACGPDAPTGASITPRAAASRVRSPDTCQAACTLTVDDRPFVAAGVPSDTVGARLDLGEVRSRGEAGAEIRLVLVGAQGSAVGGSDVPRFIVDVDGIERRFSATQLAAGVTVYRFTSNRSVVVTYSILRGGPVDGGAAARLTQQLLGNVHVEDSRTPWARGRPIETLAAVTTSETRCSVPSPGTYCNIGVTFNPYFVGSPFGEFQNPQGTGASQSINIAFEFPVNAVAVSIADPDFAGNRLVVNTLFGGSNSYDFVGDNTPGTYTEYQLITGDRGVVSIDLIPAANDYVAYFGLSFAIGDSIVVTCDRVSVQRADPAGVSCTATSSNSNETLQIQEWNFIGGPGNTIRVISPTSSPTWSGMMVATGTIEARGVFTNGGQATGRKVITVTGRSWSSMLPQLSVREGFVRGLPVRPTAIGDLGVTALPTAFPDGTGSAWIFDDGYAQVPPGGPNAGAHYLTRVPVNLDLVIEINRTALSVGSDFYNRQYKNNAPAGKCRQADVVPFIPVVEAHEGTAWQTGSHTERYRTRLNQIAGPGTEAVVGMTYDELQTRANAAVGPLYADAANAGARADDPPNRPVYCEFRYF